MVYQNSMDAVAQIKQSLDIVDVVGGYVSLKKSGRNYKGVCPFHSEKTPSFMVNQELQIFKCFGCGQGGDIFTFVEQMEGLDFGRTLELLADKANIKLEKKDFDVHSQLKNKIYKINETAARFFNYLLTKHSLGKKGLLYLKDKRRLEDGTIETFLLGYAPDSWDTLLKFLIKKGFSAAEVMQAGLVVPRKGDGSGYYDKFRGRIIFPFFESDGKIVGFTGRTVIDQEPKYLNSPETPVFNKSNYLYGLDKARTAIKKQGAVFVEGQVDVISAHQAGIKNVIATTGTALTTGQLN
ncbi:DNA primase, partial [candidate division WWE3 bacterium RIFOXYB2_FULL_41_6]